MTSHRVEIRRLKEDGTPAPEIKDPSVVKRADDSYVMFATWPAAEGLSIGRFEAKHPGGPWQELPPVTITGISGPEICAPSVVIDNGEWKMYVQTSCFSADGVIAAATSKDGVTFTGAQAPVMTKGDVPGTISLYDVAVSTVMQGGKEYDCMVFSGYRAVGNGDVYVSMREKGTEKWGKPALALKQEDVPFHNKPGSKNYEWGLEGAKVVQLDDDAFLMIGVAFLDKNVSERGTRQRVFFAASKTPQGPFLAMDTPIAPTAYPEGTGENGHPDTIDMGDKIGILYQERAGEGKPWHLRYAEETKDDLLLKVRERLAPPAKPASLSAPKL